MIQNSRIELHATPDPWGRFGVDLTFAAIHSSGGVEHVAISEPVVFNELTEETRGMRVSQAMHVAHEDLQQFMDELWRVGIRPTNGAGSVGQLAATERHLEDMRTLVFKGKT